MHTHTHGIVGWLLAEAFSLESRRDRVLVFLAGVAPDLDALTFLGGSAFYQRWHHVLLHHGAGALLYAGVAAALATRRALVGVLAFVGFHLHLLGDYLGSAGPDGSLWSVPYLVPFDLLTTGEVRHYYNPHQWQLSSWQNIAITIVALLVCAHLGARRGRTFLEALPWGPRIDGPVVEVLRRRWPWAAPDRGQPRAKDEASPAEAPPDDAPPAEVG